MWRWWRNLFLYHKSPKNFDTLQLNLDSVSNHLTCMFHDACVSAEFCCCVSYVSSLFPIFTVNKNCGIWHQVVMLAPLDLSSLWLFQKYPRVTYCSKTTICCAMPPRTSTGLIYWLTEHYSMSESAMISSVVWNHVCMNFCLCLVYLQRPTGHVDNIPTMPFRTEILDWNTLSKNWSSFTC